MSFTTHPPKQKLLEDNIIDNTLHADTQAPAKSPFTIGSIIELPPRERELQKFARQADQLTPGSYKGSRRVLLLHFGHY